MTTSANSSSIPAIDATINSYAKHSAKCIKNWKKSIKCELLDTIIHKYCKNKESVMIVLDIGCGLGLDAFRFANEGNCNVTAIDKTTDFINFAKENHKNMKCLQFIECDFTHIFSVEDQDYQPSIAKQKFNIFWANASLIHIPKADCAQFLSLLPTFASSEMNLFCGIFSKGTNEGIHGGNFAPGRYFSEYNEKELQEMFENQGWTVIEICDAKNYGRSGDWIQIQATIDLN